MTSESNTHRLDQMMVSSANRGHTEGVLDFLAQGADIHSQNYRGLRIASTNGHLKVVQTLIPSCKK